MVKFLLMFLFFNVGVVNAEEVEDVDVSDDVEIVEVRETVEHLVTIEQEEEVLSVSYPDKQLSGIPVVIENVIVDELSGSYPYWYNAISEGLYDYVLYYNELKNEYVLMVLDDEYFRNGVGFFYFVTDDFGVEGIRQLAEGEDVSLQNPFTVYFDGDTGLISEAYRPGGSYSTNLTFIPNSYLLYTSLPYGETSYLPPGTVYVPSVGQSGFNWPRMLERRILLREGVELYETHWFALVLFIGFVFVFVRYFSFGYFTKKY